MIFWSVDDLEQEVIQHVNTHYHCCLSRDQSLDLLCTKVKGKKLAHLILRHLQSWTEALYNLGSGS